MKSAILKNYRIETDRLFFEVDVMGRLFATSIWYKDLDFNELRTKIGKNELNRIVAHIAAFEMNKYGSLRLHSVDIGELSIYVDSKLVELWENIFLHVWAQWRFENNLPNDKAPELISRADKSFNPIKLPLNRHKALTFFGGGKDSFVSSHLLQKSEIRFDILEYSSSIYGNRAEQVDVSQIAHDSSEDSLINSMAVYDDFLDSPIVEYDGEQYKIKTLAAAETPASVFECLPLALERGYSSFALGHEKSANYPNLNWSKEGMNPINHQWGKSLQAQKQMASYIKDELISDLKYYSTLMPLSDPAIFTLFSKLPWSQQVNAHSCNVKKPWCKRCAKCVYVWLFYMAFLDDKKVTDEIFDGEILFDIKENYDILRKLAGLDSQTPFECVGQPPESRLAIAICHKKGYNQPIIDELLKHTSDDELLTTLSQQLTLDQEFLKQCDLPIKVNQYYEESVSKILKSKHSQLRLLFLPE
jgi:hypothetical protein